MILRKIIRFVRFRKEKHLNKSLDVAAIALAEHMSKACGGHHPKEKGARNYCAAEITRRVDERLRQWAGE